MRIPILYQDADLVVVNKPAGIPTHARDTADPYPADALRIVQAQAGLAYLGMHQRLDAETSGVLLFSARREANRALAAAFEGREIHKVYLALVWGRPPQFAGIIDAPIVREHGERYRVAAAGDPRGLAARTRYRVLEPGPEARDEGAAIRGQESGARAQGTEVTGHALRSMLHAPRSTVYTDNSATYTLLELIPETGRPHQIRVHLAHLGCPVVGDPLYGPADRPASRLCLHAYQLTIPHPATGQPMTFTAPPPDRWAPAPPTPLPHKQGGDERPYPARQAANRRPFPARAGGGGEVIRREAAWREVIRLAIARRAPLAADPDTTIYRLVNAAGDGLPGLTVDRYGDALVASVYDEEPGGLSKQPILRELVQAAGARAIYVKYRPQQASRVTEAEMAQLAPPRPVFGPDLAEFVAHEDGLSYVIRPGAGLSVGLFPDMREGRGRVRAWAAGRRVLNTFAYTCGFGAAALAGGAARVLNLDLSKPVLAWGQENYRTNGFEPDPHDFVYGDVFDWLARLAKRGDQFDLVILDPPGFSRTKTRRFSAAQDYGALATLAARVTAADGLILACCNVAELPWRAFREQVVAGVAAAGRTAAVAGVYHEPAVDFPVALGNEPYLKLLLAQLGGQP